MAPQTLNMSADHCGDHCHHCGHCGDCDDQDSPIHNTSPTSRHAEWFLLEGTHAVLGELVRGMVSEKQAAARLSALGCGDLSLIERVASAAGATDREGLLEEAHAKLVSCSYMATLLGGSPNLLLRSPWIESTICIGAAVSTGVPSFRTMQTLLERQELPALSKPPVQAFLEPCGAIEPWLLQFLAPLGVPAESVTFKSSMNKGKDHAERLVHSLPPVLTCTPCRSRALRTGCVYRPPA